MEEPIILRVMNNDIMLDDVCWVCDGGNKTPDDNWKDENGICENCNGKGFELTNNGLKILELLKRHR
jgi:hypothetical protein